MRYSKSMKIALATGIYPPEIGGHSFYVQSLERALRQQGHDVRLVLYGRLKQYPTGIRHILYAIKLWWQTRDSHGVIAFDTFSIAVPAGLVARFSKRKIVSRAGGDFVWETYVERTHDFIPLPDFYVHRDRWNIKERISYRLIHAALSRVHIAFSSAWMRDIWLRAYSFDTDRTHVIENAVEPPVAGVPPARKNFLFYTRDIALKNHAAFRQAFELAKSTCPDIELEEGAISHDELMEKIRDGYAVLLPSISEISPNYILESLRFGKPFLLTKYSAYAEKYKDCGVIVDPLNIEDMARGVRELADDTTYTALRENISRMKDRHSYDEIAREYIALLNTL